MAAIAAGSDLRPGPRVPPSTRAPTVVDNIANWGGVLRADQGEQAGAQGDDTGDR
jgi:hypothetical protein